VNHYPHHIGDYAKDTMGLSQGEHGAYRLLMDSYYATERPLPDDKTELYAIARATSPAERKATDRVLGKYFTLKDGAYHKNRIDEEIAAYQVLAENARSNGRKGGRPRNPEKTDPVISGIPRTEPNKNPEGNPDHNPNETQTKANQIPIAKGSEPIGSGGKPPTDPEKEEIWRTGKAILTGQGMSRENAASLIGGLVKKHGQPTVLLAIRDCVKVTPANAQEWLPARCQERQVGNLGTQAQAWVNTLTGGGDEQGRVIEGAASRVG
jgi:uncharacterized protein YdaU (DUF1376 family)